MRKPGRGSLSLRQFLNPIRHFAAIQEAVLVEQEVKKGDAGHPTVTGRADLFRNNIWDRWRGGEGLPPLTTSLTDAIGKVADRQLTLLQQANTVHQPPRSTRPPRTWWIAPSCRPGAIHPPHFPNSLKLMSGHRRCSARSRTNTSRSAKMAALLRARSARLAGVSTCSRLGRRPALDQYMLIDLQNYVNELPYLPLQSLKKEMTRRNCTRWGSTPPSPKTRKSPASVPAVDAPDLTGSIVVFPTRPMKASGSSFCASARINTLLKRGGAAGKSIEVGQSLRHGGKEMLIEEDFYTQTTRLQMGHRTSDPHAGSLGPTQFAALFNTTFGKRS